MTTIRYPAGDLLWLDTHLNVHAKKYPISDDSVAAVRGQSWRHDV